MKKHLKKYLWILAVMILLLALTSCNNDVAKEAENASLNNKNKTPMVVIVAGAHNNSEIMQISSEVSATAESVFTNFGDIRVVVADGNPELALKENGDPIGYCTNTYIEQSKNCKSDNELIWKRRYLNPQMGDFTNYLNHLTPNDPEVDTLAAIFEARDVMYSIMPADETSFELIIYDTGLSTTGSLDFLHEDLLELLYCEEKLNEESVHDLINSLSVKSEIPDLTGIKVTWYGLGQVAGKQELLSRLNIENLKTIWGEILREANAEPSDANADSVYGYFGYSSSYGATSYNQKVTPVHNWIMDEPIVLSTTLLGFKGDSSELKSIDIALDILEPYADNLLRYPDMEILLVGTTADPERNGGSISLSEERAKVVKGLFQKLGVPGSQFTILGWGANPPLYDEREWDGDHFIESYAEKNRSVIIMPLQCELAQSLLQEAQNRSG